MYTYSYMYIYVHLVKDLVRSLSSTTACDMLLASDVWTVQRGAYTYICYAIFPYAARLQVNM